MNMEEFNRFGSFLIISKEKISSLKKKKMKNIKEKKMKKKIKYIHIYIYNYINI